ncbi:uncharacterized protein [Branchiostoma lanceolatum]|uniref:uncharacterized protein n=1 Tax=Branchiostoma lanceolatum TaxID=7740 RepID=UPI003455C344
MVQISRCCGLWTIPVGCMATAAGYCIFAMIGIILSIAKLANLSYLTGYTYDHSLTYVGLALNVVLLLLCNMLFLGVLRKHASLCFAWVAGMALWACVNMSVAVLTTDQDIDLINSEGSISDDAGPIANVHAGLIASWILVVAELLLLMYCGLVVHTHAQRLSRERVFRELSATQSSAETNPGNVSYGMDLQPVMGTPLYAYS